MPVTDKQNRANVFENGADLPVEVLLTSAEAVAVYGAGAVAGWYRFTFTKESELGPRRSRELQNDERGVFVKNQVKQRQAMLKVTAMQTDTATLTLIDLLAAAPHRYRTGFDVAGGLRQLHGFRNAYVTGDWSMSGKEGEMRMIPIEIMASRTADGKDAHYYADVNPADELTWPTGAADFLTAAVAP